MLSNQFSGVSWTVVVNGRGGRNIVSVINDWPHPHSRNPNNDKVPSAISYTGTGEISGWGFEVSHDPNSFKFRWMKILLEPSHKYYTDIKQVKFANADLERLKKTPEDVVNDYLSCLWKYTVEHLKRRKGDNFQEDYNVKVVLTVPAVWSDSGKDKTLKAARAAGIPGKIELVTEPEAAAIAVLNEKNDLEELKVRKIASS